MDLGFGDKNQQIGEATANALMRGAEAHDRGLDSELARYDRLFDDEVRSGKRKCTIVWNPALLRLASIIVFSNKKNVSSLRCSRNRMPLKTFDKNEFKR